MSWREKDQDRFDFAIIVDEKLQADPAWQGKSLDERFAEAARHRWPLVMRLPLPPGTRQGGGETCRFHPVQPFGTRPDPSCRPHWVERFGAMSQTELIGEMGAMTTPRWRRCWSRPGTNPPPISISQPRPLCRGFLFM